MADNGRESSLSDVASEFEKLAGMSDLSGTFGEAVLVRAAELFSYEEIRRVRSSLDASDATANLTELPILKKVPDPVDLAARAFLRIRDALRTIVHPDLFRTTYANLDIEMLTRGPAADIGFGVLSEIESIAVGLYIKGLMSGLKPRLKVGVAEDHAVACATAFEVIRRDYLHPDNPVKVSPQEWRENADIICDAIVEKSVREGNLKPEKTTIAISLRSGLALAAAFARRGFRNFVYVDVERREKDASAQIHQQTTVCVIPADHVVVCPDPMLATGGSLAETLLQVGIQPGDKRRIIAVSVISVPEGHFHLARKFPGMQFFTAALDRCLNEAAFICDGLGDFGNNYFADVVGDLLEAMIMEWKSIGLLVRDEDETMLRKRFARHIKDPVAVA